MSGPSAPVAGAPEPGTPVATTAEPALARANRSVWSSTGIVFVGNVIARGLGFLFPLVLARAVDRQDFALVYLTITTGFFVGELVLAGYPTSLTRYLAAPGGADRGAWFATAGAAGLYMFVLSSLLGIVFAIQAAAEPSLILLVIVGLTIDAYYFASLRGLGRFTLLVGYRVGANLAQILALLAAWWLGIASAPVAVAIYALTYLIPIVAIEVTVGPVRGMLGRGARPSRALLGPLTRFAVPALISGTAYAAILGLDVYWVRLLAPQDLADYGAARALAMPMSLVPFAIGVVLLPRVAATDVDRQWRLLTQAVGATIGAAVLAVIGYWLLAPFLIDLVYPETYVGAAATLPPLALAMGAVGLYSVMTQWWMGRGDPRRPAAALVIGAIATAIAHVQLDATYGGLGAAASMLIGALTAIAILLVMTWRLPDRPGHDARDRMR